MRVLRLHIPPKGSSLEGAIYETTWGLTPAFFFWGQLKDISTSSVDPFSLELHSANSAISVCLAGDENTIRSLTSTIYGYLGDIEAHEIPDYTRDLGERSLIAGADLCLELPDIYPLQSYKAFAWDSMAPIVTALGRVPDTDSALVQVLVRPLRDSIWLQMETATSRYINKLTRFSRPRHLFKQPSKEPASKLIAEKCSMPLFRVNVRISSRTELPSGCSKLDIHRARERLKDNITSLSNALKTLNTTHENRFKMRSFSFGSGIARKISERRFDRPFKLSALELTSLWHVPSLGTLPNTYRVLSRKSPPPRDLPTTPQDSQISFFGQTNYREQRMDFGLRRFDRRRHLYVLGKSGSGKSCLLQLLIKSDIEKGYGCAVLDPHGDLVDDVLRHIPQHRIKDVVIFDPSDIEHPPSFNPMIPIQPDQHMRVTLSFLDTFKKVFGDSWSDKMDHVLRYAMIALINVPGSSVVSLRRLLSDTEFRSAVVAKSTDPVVRRFWEVEFPSRREEFEAGPIPHLLNKLDELLATDMIRNILGQPTNSFDFREFMDSRKIILFKISKGLLGAENASLLGSLIIWKIYEAAMSRADQAADARRDFYFYVDEFQNFATSSFGEILSESRKYRLCLTFANQFLGQLPAGATNTVFGNIANLISFRVGSHDADTVANEFKPHIGAADLINLGTREFYLKMSINGEVHEAFSARTLDVRRPSTTEAFVDECIAHSRSKYAIPLAQAEEQLALSEILSPRAMGIR